MRREIEISSKLGCRFNEKNSSNVLVGDCLKAVNHHSLSLSDRRTFLSQSIAAATAIGGLVFRPVSVLAADSAAFTAEERLTRVKSVLEVRGEVRLKKTNENNDAVRTAPIESKATLQYEERFAVADQFAQSVLNFQVAEGSITVENHATDSKLRDDAKTMVRWTNGSESTLYTAGAETPLTESEKKLSESPLVSMYLESLVPKASLRVGEKFDLEKSTTAKLLSLEAIQKGVVSVALIDQNESEQQLEFSADLSATVNAVPTKLKLTGKATCKRESKLVTYCAVTIQEERDIGYAEPGFKINARLRLIREEIEQTVGLKSLSEYSSAFERNQESRLQLFDSIDGGYRFTAEADWVVYKDGEIDSLLRLVRSNRSLAQCNIVNLADMEPGKQLKLEAFKLDVQRVLGKSFGRLAEENERLTKKNLRLMRVIATGNVAGVDVIWINMLISNDEGRHVSIVFTSNADRIDELNDADIQIADTFEFTRRLKSKEELAESESDTTKK